MIQLYTRQQVEDMGLLHSKPYSVLADAFIYISYGFVDKMKLYHSDVYYVRAALEKHSGYYFSLKQVEDAMLAEGWREHRHMPRKKQTKGGSK